MRKDEPINLNCVINYSTNSTSSLILWYHNSVLLNYNKDVITKSKILFNKESATSYLHSNLRINQADSPHSGNYTCELTNVGFLISSNPISVHVLNDGENMAAINYNAVNNYNKHRALKDEFGILLDNSSINQFYLNNSYLICLNLLLYLLSINYLIKFS